MFDTIDVLLSSYLFVYPNLVKRIQVIQKFEYSKLNKNVRMSSTINFELFIMFMDFLLILFKGFATLIYHFDYFVKKKKCLNNFSLSYG